MAAILGMPIGTINEIISGKRGITSGTARRLADALGTASELWMNLDTAYELSKVKNDDFRDRHSS